MGNEVLQLLMIKSNAVMLIHPLDSSFFHWHYCVTHVLEVSCCVWPSTQALMSPGSICGSGSALSGSGN